LGVFRFHANRRTPFLLLFALSCVPRSPRKAQWRLATDFAKAFAKVIAKVIE
jgi:hypothetical protein